MTKVVAIHQPNFFPWLGYFDKISRADSFLFLDNVQFPKKGGSWSNRIKLLISGDARWITAAIDRSYSGTRQIREMHFLSQNPWRQKMFKTLEINYKPSEVKFNDLLKAINESNIDIEDISIKETRLEDVFLKLTQG